MTIPALFSVVVVVVVVSCVSLYVLFICLLAFNPVLKTEFVPAMPALGYWSVSPVPPLPRSSPVCQIHMLLSSRLAIIACKE